MGITLTDVLLFGKAQSDDVDNATLVIYRRNILRWSALGGYLDIIVKGVAPLSLPDAIANSLSYVKAFGGTEQRNLPAGYTQLEYIGGTGTQYIDTGVLGTDVTAFELKGTITANGGQNTQFIGGTNQAATSFFGARSMGATVTWYCMSSQGASLGNPAHVCVVTSTIESASSQPGTLYDTETGTTTEYAKFASATRGFGEENILLFGGSETRRSPNATCYYLKLYTANGLAFYGIPAKNSSNVVGLYDVVSGTFFANDGTGDFAAGPTVAPTPTAPMDIVCNNGVLKARHQSGLPLGYTAVEYLQNGSGNCAINTGIAPTNTTRVEMKWSVSDTSSIYIFGSRPGGSTQVFTLSGSQSGGTVTAYANGYYKAANTDGVNWSRTSGIDNIFNSYFALNNGEAEYAVDDLVNGRHCDEFFTYTPWVSDIDTPLHLFSNGYNSQPDGAKIWYCKIYDGETLLMDLVPVIRNSDNVGGFYDKVGGGFYTTEQGGTYTGTPITDPVEIYTDGTVETIVSRGANLFNKSSYEEITAYVNANTGVLTQGTTQKCAVIPCEPNTTYIIANRTTSAWGSFADKTIGSVATAFVTTDNVLTTGANDRYLIGLVRTTDGTYDYRDTLNVSVYGGTATAEMLLKVGDYQDVQSIIDGVVTRNVGIKVLDGTESWAYVDSISTDSYSIFSASGLAPNKEENKTVLSSHFIGKQNQAAITAVNQIGFSPYAGQYASLGYISLAKDTYQQDTAKVRQWLASQYAAGTPVIVIYPLATPTTESVAGQTLQVTGGDNVLEITQASLTGLELEAEYQAAVSLTIQEVQDANLDPNVEVTIN